MKSLTSLGKFSLWKSFFCLGVLWLLAVSIPTVFYWKEIGSQIALSRYEQQGLPPVQLMLNIIQRTQEHRVLTARFLQEDALITHSAYKKERRAKAEELEESIVDLEDYARKIKNSKIEKLLDEITADWHQISQHVTVRDISVDQNFQMHLLLVRKQLNALQMMLDMYQLSRDAEPNGYFLISSSLTNLPQLVEVLAQMNTAGETLLIKNEASFFERAELKSMLLLTESKAMESDAGIAKAMAENSTLKESIQQQYQKLQEQYQRLASATQDEILSKANFSYAPDDFNTLFAQGINDYYQFMHVSLSQIDQVLKNRMAEKAEARYRVFMIVIIATLLVVFIYGYYVRKLLKQLGGDPVYAIDAVQSIAHGNLERHIVTAHPDSLVGNIKVLQSKLKESN